MTEEFVLPQFWFLEIDDENRDIVNDWRINIIKYSNEPCKYKYISENGIGDTTGANSRFNTFNITTSQFKQYVLNIKEPITEQQPEDLSYLIDFLNNNNIK